MKVEAVTLAHRALVEDVSAVGELRSSESVVVRPEVDGRISEIRFTEGTPIEEGALLLRLDDSVPRAELAEARARLDLTRRTYKRARATQSRGHTSEQALDEASAHVRASEAAVALVEARLHKTAILAPFSGIVGLRNVSVGSYVEAGDDITVLEKIDPLKIDFQVPERYLRAVRVGGLVEVHVDAFPAQAYQGSIYAIDPQVDRDNRSISVRARLANPDRVLRSGLFARIRLIIDRRSDAIMVPEEALIPRGARRYVYRVRGWLGALHGSSSRASPHRLRRDRLRTRRG